MEGGNVIKILAVDDDSFIRKIIKICLPMPSFDVTTCSNAMEAMEQFRKKPFDLLILDILMPVINGLELRALIRRENTDIPIIMLTAKVDDAEGTLLKEISNDGNTYYQNKNFSKGELEKTVTDIISKLRANNEEKSYFAEMEKDVSLAGDIQRFLFPHWFLMKNGATFSHYYHPYMKITGDVVNVFSLGEGVFLEVVGDISGHGIRSALCMSAVEISITEFIRQRSGKKVAPHELLNHLQSFMEDISTEHYMTCLIAVIDFSKNTLTYQTAGHPDFITYSPSQGVVHQSTPKEKGSIPVGLIKGTVYNLSETREISLPPDAIIFAYTDGLGDMENDQGETADSELLKEFISSVVREGLTPSTNVRIIDAFYKLGYTSIRDDILLSAITRTNQKPGCYNRTISPSIGAVDDFVQSVYKLTFEQTKDATFSAKIEILLTEFLNNVVIHSLGNRNAMRPVISVHIEFRADDVLLIIYDKGKAWDIHNVEVDDRETDLQNQRLDFSGRGLTLMRKIATSLSRNRYADSLNETTFTINYK